MKKILLITVPVFLVLLYLAPLWNLYLPSNEYPALEIPDVNNKKALIVAAHDDDACGMAGLVSTLSRAGWELTFVTFYNDGDGRHAPENSIRKEELRQYAEKFGIQNVMHEQFAMRKGNPDTITAAYMPVATELVPHYFKTDSLRALIEEYIDAIQPSLIISLDDEMGGYGHPEHVLVAKTISDICIDMSVSSPDFPVKYFYQNVHSRKQSEHLHTLPVYVEAKKIYKIDGMPIPDAELDVSNLTAEKKFGLSVWKSQVRNIRKFFPYFEFYPHWLYFNVADREYYHILKF